MADVKIHITDLEELEELNENCFVLVDDGTDTYKFNANKLKGGGAIVQHFTPENIVQGTITTQVEGEIQS